MSDPEMQFVYGTCDMTGCFNAEGVLEFLLFIFGIFKFFSSY